MSILGTGIEIINYPTVKVKAPDGVTEDQISDEGRSFLDERGRFLKIHRGDFISGCTEIDNTLSEAISSFFFKDNTDINKREQFHDFIIDTPIFSFIQKKKVLQSIMEKYPTDFPSFTGKSRQEMFNQINYIIKMRNAFAHGTLIINYGEKMEALSYFDSQTNTRVEQTLTEEFFNELYKKLEDLSTQILECIPSVE
ncbi:hypothetical protein [uncultured Methanoregula sp.]|uniref:hypothetical protein n=1 Tax=uncultured Methanoregula sp. TaxID=1005933 RepID=UPI002AAB5C96|nr:hypothetical protein [uncultured Methanoregula sp.]